MNLLKDNILGILDSQGDIKSINTGENIECHGEYFPRAKCHWRWDYNKSI